MIDPQTRPDKGGATEIPATLLDELAERRGRLNAQLRRVIVGQPEAIDLLTIAVFLQEHALIIGVPGLAKTLLVRTLARCVDLRFSRIQFTPDMMPADVIGTEIIQVDRSTGDRALRFAPGPVFANLILADEINRTPPKTQAALLEAMAERQVTVGGETRRLEPPFIVFATQNPIEQEGAYPLPEAQLDRFMFSVWMDYPSRNEERLITADAERLINESVEVVFHRGDLIRFRQAILQMPVSDHVIDYAIDLVRATRPRDPSSPARTVQPYISWGAGPRASQHLIAAARALAAMEGEPTPSAEHVRRLAMPILRHRLVLNYAATGEGLSARDLVDRIVEAVPEDEYQ
ncbi:MAG: AAA family ATPase [Phycisphaerales bacterium]